MTQTISEVKPYEHLSKDQVIAILRTILTIELSTKPQEMIAQ